MAGVPEQEGHRALMDFQEVERCSLGIRLGRTDHSDEEIGRKVKVKERSSVYLGAPGTSRDNLPPDDVRPEGRRQSSTRGSTEVATVATNSPTVSDDEPVDDMVNVVLEPPRQNRILIFVGGLLERLRPANSLYWITPLLAVFVVIIFTIQEVYHIPLTPWSDHGGYPPAF